MPNIDFEIIAGPRDTVYLICPQTKNAKEYLSDIVPANGPWLGPNLGIGSGEMHELVGALFDDGFELTLNGDPVLSLQRSSAT